jgi:hypothetical protein
VLFAHPTEPVAKSELRAATPASRSSFTILLADTERLESLHHARGMRSALCGTAGRYLKRRAIHAAAPGDLSEQSHAGDRRSARARRPVDLGVRSGAILQYLGRKTGKFYPTDERARVAVDEWLFWQMSGLGPMSGQAVHFRRYAPRQIAYAIARYTDEVSRLYGVMNARLANHEFLAGRYSIADMACVGWVRLAGRQGQDLAQFPHLKRWFETVRARAAVKRAFAIRIPAASAVDMRDPSVRAVLFGQRSFSA